MAQGGAKFNRLEGCWEDDGTIFFVSTSGGDAKNGDVNSDGYAEGFGQVWAYRPGRSGGRLTLVYESPSGSEMDGPDNITDAARRPHHVRTIHLRPTSTPTRSRPASSTSTG